MQRIVEKSAMISSERQSPIQGLLPLAMEAGSNIVKAISMAARAQTDLWFFREKLAQSIESLEKFVKVRTWIAYLILKQNRNWVFNLQSILLQK